MDIEWLIYHLIHNDDDQFTSILDLDIDLCRSDLDQWDRLLVGFSRNRTVTSIELSRGYQRPVVTDDDLQKLCSALRQLPKLSKVKLDSFTTFDLEQTESLFVNNVIIEEVWIENAQCYYEDEEGRLDEGNAYEDYERYELFLGYLASMSRNRLRHLRIEVPEKLSHGSNITSLLSGSSKLESVVIETTSLLSPTAQTIPRVAPNEEDRHRKFATAMAALQSNFALKTLDIDFRISFADFKHVANMLKHNKTLSELRLRLETTPGTICGANNSGIDHIPDYDPNFIESIQLFFEALKTNTNSALKSFSQYNLDDPEIQLVLSGLHDKSLKTSGNCITYPKITQNLIDLGLDMLQFNLSLEYFSFFLFDNNNLNLAEKKEIFLRLNMRGRRFVEHRDISESVPKSSWVDQLSKHSMDDQDGLYYYISTNPLICRTVQEDATCSASKQAHAVTALKEKNKHSKREKATIVERYHLKKTRDALRSSQSNDEGLIKASDEKRRRVDDITI